MKVIHQKTGTVLGRNVKAVTSFLQRLRGYMFYANPPSDFDGLYFPSNNQVHNSFVRFSLDIVFIDKKNSVVKVIRGFRPWRFSWIYLRAAHTLEFPAGTVPESVVPGDLIILEN